MRISPSSSDRSCVGRSDKRLTPLWRGHRSCAGAWFTGALLAIGTLPATTRAQTGEIVGSVVAAESGAHLPYSVISATPGDERFTTDSGTFTLTGLPAGIVHLRVRHLGFIPADTTINVHAGQRITVSVALHHLAVSLAAVEVSASRSCARPGMPDASADSALASIFGQLEQNAERYELLLRQYPFVATYEITNGVRRADTLNASLADRPAVVQSDKHWSYSPGAVIVTGPRASAVVNDPTLDVFVEPAFLATHCFSYGGREAVAGDTLLKIDFRVANRIHTPDFDGSIYLDPDTYLLRYSAFRLSTLPRALSNADSSSVVTRFDELLPGVPFVADILSTLYLSPRGRPAETQGPMATLEERRRIIVRFQGNEPAGAYVDDVSPRLLPFSARHAAVRRVLGVFDLDTGDPIPNVVVTDSITRLSARTTITGTVTLNFVSAAGGALTLTREGYTPISLHVPVTLADTAPITTTMSRLRESRADGAAGRRRIVVTARTPEGKAVRDADVSAVRGRDTVVARARTDSTGRAALTLDSTTTAYDVVVRKLGFARADRYVALESPDTQVVSVVMEPVVQQLTSVQVVAQQSERYRRLNIDADTIAATSHPLLDATDIIAKLRPDMTYGLGGRGFCPPAQHLWVNGREVFPEQVFRDDVAISHAQGNVATKYLMFFITSALAHIRPEHIAEMHAEDCTNLALGKDRSSALFITLKPGISYDPARGSYVGTSSDSLQGR